MRKYPEGDWMTSPQWFEEVEGGICANRFIDIQLEDGTGLQFASTTPLQWFVRGNKLEAVVMAVDPWDEGKTIHFPVAGQDRVISVNVHGPTSHADLWLMANRDSRWSLATDEDIQELDSDMPAEFQALRSEIQGVIPTAFYREEEGYSSRGLDSYAGEGMGYPFVIRLVEFNGEEVEGTIRVAGQVTKAVKANMLGAPTEELKVTPAQTSENEICHLKGKASDIHLKVNTREIVTLYLDIEEGRKQARDLDAKREIWATVHRVED